VQYAKIPPSIIRDPYQSAMNCKLRDGSDLG
jgi:hypothetical protein